MGTVEYRNLTQIDAMLRFITTISSLLISTQATSGFDFADAVFSVSDFECLAEKGYEYMIVRAWESIGSFDDDAPSNLKNAQSAGYASANTSVYMFPCASTADSAKAQMQTMIDDLKDYDYGMIWLDIEENPSSGCSWSDNDIDTNCDIIIALGNTTVENGKKVGVYSNYNEWSSYVFFGDSGACSQLSDMHAVYVVK